MKYNKVLKYILVLLAIAFIVYFSFLIVLNRIYNSRSDEIVEYIELSQMLDRDFVDFSLDSNSINVLTSWQLVSSINRELPKIEKMRVEVENINQDFNQAYEEMQNRISEYSDYIDEDELLPDISIISFEEKKRKDEYFFAVYSNLRSEVAEYNELNKPLQVEWNYDVKKEVQLMTLQEKIGQLFMFGFDGQNLSYSTYSEISEFSPSGVILMGSNIYGESQLRELNESLQSTSNLYPLFISVDQEGSPVKRITWDPTPGQKYMSQNNSPEEACDLYRQRDDILWNLGINVNFGLVADITSDRNSFIYNRVFSGDAREASDYIVKGVECSEKTFNTVKHFPGHGRTNVDTHKAVASYSIDIETWKKQDGKVFQDAIDNGAKWVMMGHLDFTQMTNGIPASLSSEAVDYLRDEMNFNGIIVTDDMNMLNRLGRSPVEDLKSAIKSGIDQILYVGTPISFDEILVIVNDMIENGEITEDDIDERIERILQHKQYILQIE